MSPQFVDLDDDGFDDILTATYDGIAYLSRGGKKGFGKPRVVTGSNGFPISLSSYYYGKKWRETHRGMARADRREKSHMTALATFDWDGDGDMDLVLGDKHSGRLWLRENRGSKRRASFAAKNVAIERDGKPISVPHTLTSVRAVDWNGDQVQDLLVATAGQTMLDLPGGAVYVFTGSIVDGRWTPGPRQVVLPPSDHRLQLEPDRPNNQIYADARDVDGDGDVDLVVSGLADWRPLPYKASAKRRYQAEKLLQRSKELCSELAAATKGPGLPLRSGRLSEAQSKQLRGLFAERARLDAKKNQLAADIDKYLMPKQRVAFVWIYENLSK